MTQICIGPATMEVETHPNAPVVVNYYITNRKGNRYNADPRRMKYASAENAQWMADVMNKGNGIFHWYIANEKA